MRFFLKHNPFNRNNLTQLKGSWNFVSVSRTTANLTAAIVVSVLGAMFAVLGAQPASSRPFQAAPAPSHSVWDGVYTQQQSDRGQTIYSHLCSSCHGDKLTGKESEDSPALAGKDFQNEWDGRTVGDLFRKIQRKMPQDNPGRLSPQESVDLVAFILNFNAFPVGKAELPPQNEALVTIRFEAKKPDQK